nr:hypothetical protein [Tanacetum cinerariifolium]
MDTTIDQQVAMDEALVPHARRLRIDVLKIYMQEFWATATVHHHSIRFKMDNKKHIVNLESFREIGSIRKLTDVNINKLHQPWRSFAAIIKKCLIGKSLGYDSLRLSQAQIIWGLYHKRNVNFTYMMWEDFVYQVEHKDTKKSNEIYYPSSKSNSNTYKEYYAVATGATPPKPKASVRKTRSSSDTTVTPPTAAVGPRLSTSAKGKQPATTSKAKSLSALSEVAMTEAQQLKLVTKRSLQQTHISQASGSGTDEGTGSIPDVLDVPTDESKEEIYWNSSDEEGTDDEQAFDEEEFIHLSLSTHAEEETRDEESFDPIPKTLKNTDDEGNGEENLGMNVGREEGQDEEDEEDKLYRDVNINLGWGIQLGDVHQTQEFEDSHVTLTPVNPDGQQQSSSVSSQFVTSMLNPTPDAGMKSIFETTLQMDVQTPTSVAPLRVSAPTLTPSTIATITTTQQAPTPPTIAPSTLLQDLSNFGSLAVSSIPEIVHRYMDQRMNEAVKVAVQLQSGRLRDEAQKENDEFLKTIDENMQKIIKKQVKEQVKILIEKIEGNKSIQRSNEQRNLFKALVETYESDKIILDTYGNTVTLKRCRDDADKDKEPSAGSDRGSKRRREGKEPESASAPKEKATRSAGKSTQGSKSRLTSTSESATAEEPMQTTFEMEEPSHPEFEIGADDQLIVEPSQHPEWFSQQKKPPTPDRDWNKTLTATHESIQPWISELAKQSDSRSFFNELMDTLGSCKSLVELEFFLEEVYKATTDQLEWVNLEGQQYPHNLLKPLPLIPNSRGRYVIPFDHFINNDLEYLRGGASSRKYTTSVTKTKAADYGHIKTLCFQRLSSNVYKKHRNPKACGRPSNRCQKLPEEAQPNKARYRWDAHDVRTALDDHLEGVHMRYLPQTIWRKSDKERATTMIQAIDKTLKTRRIMRSLERFVGGRLYEGDFRMLQRTI